MGTVGSHDQSCEDKMTSLVIACLVMGAAAQGHALSKRSAVHAVPVVSTPAIATAGYAVGASGAVGGQAPATIAAPAPVVAYNAGALPVAHHSAVAIASHAIPAEHHSVPIVPLTHDTVGATYPHALSYGLKSAPCVNVNNVPVPCATGALSYGLSSLSPPIWSSPNLVSTTYSSPDITPPDNEVAGVVDNEVAGVVDLRTAASDRKKRDAGYLGYHGGYLAT